MIRVHVVQGDGYMNLTIGGHAKDKLVCCAVSTLSDTIVTMLEKLSNEYPGEIKFILEED